MNESQSYDHGREKHPSRETASAKVLKQNKLVFASNKNTSVAGNRVQEVDRVR